MNNIEKLLATYTDETQELETAIQQVLNDRWLDTSVGVQLDGLGQIVGRERQGATDETYRRLLSAQIALNLSTGSVQDVVSILELFLPGVTLELKQEYPAAFTVTAMGTAHPTSVATIAAEAMGQARGGGVRALFHYFSTLPIFYLDGYNGATFDGPSLFSATVDGRG